MVQVPAPVKLTTPPVMEQTDALAAAMAKVTGLPEAPPVAVGA